MLICFLFICLSNIVSGQLVDLSASGYHDLVGMPKAREILRAESVVGRIVGGSQTATADAYPYKAGIVVTLTSGWTSVCGGSLLSDTRVLTAAHCWWDGRNQARTFTIVLGSLKLFSGGTRVDSTAVTVHASWNPDDVLFDVAMVKIGSVKFNNNIQPIPLPSAADVNQDFSGVTAVAAGFGKTSDSQNSFPTTTSLHHVTLQVITNTVCQKSFDVPIHGSHLCTNGVNGFGTCDGDSGGPLTTVWNNQRILIGVTSFGIGDRCQGGYPSVFSRVTAYLNWIQGNMYS
ncbi:collagenase-like [Leguminivora glycinivorella]|uniref:collagenase-like n=1 Tax=Leguminivora glycinivorella TaxID=1035111 RepID=UPI00200E2D8B|nr:collagenase-like [Leguminivora glycinivorella]